ncbi:MAG: phosphoglycerate kinase [Bacteroidales bacterium]|nr:phosphoglycerate kinase [Bacteroidales bacterium]
MQKIDNYNFKGKKVIVRVDFNVPLNKETGEVSDDTRIRGALPTIKKIIEDGGCAILMSHMGKPKNVNPAEGDAKFSLKQIIPAIEKYTKEFGVPTIAFAEDCANADAAASALKPGQILLLQNLRYYAAEEGKPRGIEKDDPKFDEAKKAMKAEQAAFAKKLASYAEVYVNDAFGTAHRKHASTAVIADEFAEDKKMFGFLINKELTAMDGVLAAPKAGFTAIMGGSKVSDKINIITNLLDRVENLIIGGGMAYTFVKAQGGNIGNSLCENDKLDLALDIIAKAKEKNVNLLLPVDALNADKFDKDAATQESAIDQTPDGWMGLDIASKSIANFQKVIESSKTLIWNGPMGVFEFDKFAAGTTAIAKAVAAATEKGAYSLIGGGDSVAAINKNKLADKVSYVSTGGGAMLEYMEGKQLPGIVAIRG